MNCEMRYASGYRRGQPCPYQTSAVVATGYNRARYVCGYHARAYVPDVIYPLDWNLARIRRESLRLIEGLALMGGNR